MQVFVWSRIRTRPDNSIRSERMLRHLLFEDFLEALIRLSTMIPLPVMADVETVGCVDGGDYLLQVLPETEVFAAFTKERAQAWFQEPRQSVWRCVNYLLQYVIRVMEASVSSMGQQDLVITAEKVERFSQKAEAGETRIEAHQALVHALSGRNEDISLYESLGLVKQKTFEALRMVEVFRSIPDKELTLLCDVMSHANFKQGGLVFERGEIGDEFFIILEGRAEALSKLHDDEHEQVCPTLLRHTKPGALISCTF